MINKSNQGVLGLVSTPILDRTFHISYKGKSGTCFAVDINNRQYFITARHLLDDMSIQSIQVEHGDNFEPWSITMVGIGTSNDIDISVFTATTALFYPAVDFDLSSNGLVLTQDVFILGFPYNLKNRCLITNGFYAPLVKKGILAGSYDQNSFYIDVMNNVGFSGGPVYTTDMRTKKMKIIGVISGFLRGNELSTPTGQTVFENSGIARVIDIKCAVDLINSNPIGLSHSS